MGDTSCVPLPYQPNLTLGTGSGKLLWALNNLVLNGRAFGYKTYTNTVSGHVFAIQFHNLRFDASSVKVEMLDILLCLLFMRCAVSYLGAVLHAYFSAHFQSELYNFSRWPHCVALDIGDRGPMLHQWLCDHLGYETFIYHTAAMTYCIAREVWLGSPGCLAWQDSCASQISIGQF
jgi:hypothetical protein